MKRKSPLRNLKLTIEYDGTAYAGWQIQTKRKTVQGEITRAIREITKEKVSLFGAGRTDAGVHAEGQVANFRTKSKTMAKKWPNALNAHLPEDIAVVRAEDVSMEFHARISAKGKIYRYMVLNRNVRSALYRGAAHLIRKDLDVPGMQKAAAHLVGELDFKSFGTNSAKKTNTTRTIRRLDVEARMPFVSFTFEGDGFLYNMVRTIVGTLLEVGYGNETVDWVKEVREAKDRKKAGLNVPPNGLTLVRVLYD